MQVLDLLRNNDRKVVTITPPETLSEAMDRLLKHRISCLPVLDEADNLIGIISDKDIFRLVHENRATFANLSVGEAMTADLIVGLPEDTLDYIAAIMTENRIRHVPIVDGPKLIGLVSQGDVVKKQLRDYQVENRYLKSYIHNEYPG